MIQLLKNCLEFVIDWFVLGRWCLCSFFTAFIVTSVIYVSRQIQCKNLHLSMFIRLKMVLLLGKQSICGIPIFPLLKIDRTPCTFLPMTAKIIQIEVWRLFHWKAECLLMKIDCFGASSHVHYGLGVSPFEAKGRFSNSLFSSYFRPNFQAIYGLSKFVTYGQIRVKMGHTLIVSLSLSTDRPRHTRSLLPKVWTNSKKKWDSVSETL